MLFPIEIYTNYPPAPSRIVTPNLVYCNEKHYDSGDQNHQPKPVSNMDSIAPFLELSVELDDEVGAV